MNIDDILPEQNEQKEGENVLWMTVVLQKWMKFDDHAATAAGTILFGSGKEKFGAALKNNNNLMSPDTLKICYGKKCTYPRINCYAAIDFVETSAFYSFPFYYTKLTATLEMQGLPSGNKFSVGAPDTNDEKVRFTNILSIKEAMFTDNVIKGTQRLQVHFDHYEKTAERNEYYPKIQISFIRGSDWISSLLKFYLPYTTFYIVAIISFVTIVDFSSFVQIIVGLLVALVMSGNNMIDVEKNNSGLLVLNTASLMFVLTIIPGCRGFSLVFPASVYIWQAVSAYQAFLWIHHKKKAKEKFIAKGEDQILYKQASVEGGPVKRLVEFKDLEDDVVAG